MAHNFGLWHPGEHQHPHLSMLLPWERTHRGGGFSLGLFCLGCSTNSRRSSVECGPSEQQIALHVGLTRSCFYPRPCAVEPVHDSVFKVLSTSSHTGV